MVYTDDAVCSRTSITTVVTGLQRGSRNALIGVVFTDDAVYDGSNIADFVKCPGVAELNALNSFPIA